MPLFVAKDYLHSRTALLVGGGAAVAANPDIVDDAAEAAEGLGAEANAATKAIDIWGESTAGSAQVRTLQTGGNIIRQATADALNEANGLDLHPREWGRALEALKSSEDLPNNFHGVIDSVGNYRNGNTGEIIGNLLDWL